MTGYIGPRKAQRHMPGIVITGDISCRVFHTARSVIISAFPFRIPN